MQASNSVRLCLITSLIVLLSSSAFGQTASEKAAPALIVKVEITKTSVKWLPQFEEKYDYLLLSIVRPDGSDVRAQFKPGEPIVYSKQTASRFVQEKLDDGRDPASKKDRSQAPLPVFADGEYRSELEVIPSSPVLRYDSVFWIREGSLVIPPTEDEPPAPTTTWNPLAPPSYLTDENS